MGTWLSGKLLVKAVTLGIALALPLGSAAAAGAAATGSAAAASASVRPDGGAEASEAPESQGERPAGVAQGLIEKGEGLSIDWTRGELTMTGMGFSPERGSLAQRRALARQTAVTDASRRLYEAVGALRVNGHAYVRDLLAVDEGLRSALHAMVASAPVQESKPWPDGSIEVTKTLSLWGEGSLSALLATVVDLGTAAPVVRAAAEAGAAPTAIVVDGRGTGSQPALAIALKDESGKLLFQGPVTYFHVPEALDAVAGPRPLKLPARRAVGATRADLTLKAEEAKRFLEARGAQPQLPIVVLL